MVMKRGKLQCFSKGSENVQQSCCAVFNTEFTVYNFCVGDGAHKWNIQVALDGELSFCLMPGTDIARGAAEAIQ
eukprot:2635487-Rhodomonas_salina.2